MPYKVAINGYGRIGQGLLRQIYGSGLHEHMQVVAINELADIDTMVYLTRYDSTFGRFPVPVDQENGNLVIEGDHIRVLNAEGPADLPWQDLDVDLLFECTGSYDDRDTAEQHLAGGAKRLLFSHPATKDVDATIIYGFNHADLKQEHRIVSGGSCTTNCIVPVLDLLDRTFGVVNGVTTTIHSAMNDQPVIDSGNPSNLRLSRSAMQSIIPVDTLLAEGIKRLLPDLGEKMQCLHMRVPTQNVSAMDLSLNVSEPVTIDQINGMFREAAQGNHNGILGYSEEPHASVDFNQDAHSCVIDGSLTRVSSGTLIKLVCWFDNEWGYSNRLLDIARKWLQIT